MFTRTTGWLIVPLWMVAMVWLVAHDVWPAWTALDPPPLSATDWLKGEGRKSQYTISDDLGPMGTIWTTYLIDETSMQRLDLVWLARVPGALAGPMRLSADSTFTTGGLLDEFTLTLASRDAGLRLHGERFHAHFSFTFSAGPIENVFKVPLTDGGIIAGAFNPLSQLSDLQVGQRWRMQVFNPMAALTGVGKRFTPMLVEVTGEDRILTTDGFKDCLVVESSMAKAWVDERGTVYLQEMILPLAGKIRIAREPEFDEEARMSARKSRLRD